MKIGIAQTNSFWIRRRPIEKLFQRIAREFPRVAHGEVSLVFVDNRRMAQLNKQYRGRSGPTDVLSFAEREAMPFAHPSRLIGEIVIAYPYARTQAHRQGITMQQEIAWLLTHGFLHLIGFDHQHPRDAVRMRQREQEIISPLFT